MYTDISCKCILSSGVPPALLVKKLLHSLLDNKVLRIKLTLHCNSITFCRTMYSGTVCFAHGLTAQIVIAHVKTILLNEGTLLLHQGTGLLQLLILMQNCCTSLVGGFLCSALGFTVGLVCLALDIVPCALHFTCAAARLV